MGIVERSKMIFFLILKIPLKDQLRIHGNQFRRVLGRIRRGKGVIVNPPTPTLDRMGVARKSTRFSTGFRGPDQIRLLPPFTEFPQKLDEIVRGVDWRCVSGGWKDLRVRASSNYCRRT